MQVTNKHRVTPIGLPGGVVIAPGSTVPVKDWDKLKGNKVVAYYLSNGILEAKADAQSSDNGNDAEVAEKEQLIAELKTYGIEADKRSKIETLREKLAKAKADAQS
ncbi:hypothetical protein [Stutzerimonas nitrititolerans]|uniref:Uncharacterized protein n=1 Tax=Stutzerimonas nitrititolerans TaxID=2482751 RepID=A0AA41WKG3_9GAMM|nr:hypothetical protein [Stutzerimonas nitrititolerans]MCO7546167.1 hypothetical protein [Stutzerimonas nitrititolerans]